jgi:hypothetical protein
VAPFLPKGQPSRDLQRSKDTKAEKAKKFVDRAVQNLTDALTSGKCERIKQYLAMLAKVHRYRFENALLILWQNGAATHVAGFGT